MLYDQRLNIQEGRDWYGPYIKYLFSTAISQIYDRNISNPEMEALITRVKPWLSSITLLKFYFFLNKDTVKTLMETIEQYPSIRTLDLGQALQKEDAFLTFSEILEKSNFLTSVIVSKKTVDTKKLLGLVKALTENFSITDISILNDHRSPELDGLVEKENSTSVALSCMEKQVKSNEVIRDIIGFYDSNGKMTKDQKKDFIHALSKKRGFVGIHKKMEGFFFFAHGIINKLSFENDKLFDTMLYKIGEEYFNTHIGANIAKKIESILLEMILDRAVEKINQTKEKKELLP